MKFNAPEIEVVKFEIEDFITTSTETMPTFDDGLGWN